MNTILEAIIIEYKFTSIIWLSNNILTIIILVLNLTDNPIPSKTDLFTPNSFFPTIKLPRIFAPFSVYFGWITVATIANITVFLVSINWSGFGIEEYIWTIIVLVVGLVIGILRMNKDKNLAYGLVLVWAYLGILLKHVSADGFSGKYPSIITTLVFCLFIFGFFIVKVILKK